MANRLKSNKNQSPDPDKLKPEKVEKVTVKDLVKDERTFKIGGTISLLLSIFLLIAFSSFLFTWQEDQDKVSAGTSIFYPSTNVETSNLVGNFGAYISHQFFFNGFGLASFLFCSLFFVIGINALLGRKVFSLWRNLRYVLVGIVFLPVLFSFIATTTKNNFFPWGGAVGDLISNWLTLTLGFVGTAALLLVAGLAFIIWRFNPVFKFSALRNKSSHELMNDESLTGNLNNSFIPGQPATVSHANLLKNGNGGVIHSKNVIEENAFSDLRIMEKDYNEEDGKERSSSTYPKNKKSLSEIELEINPVTEEEVDEEADVLLEKIPVLEPYEPTLDLRDYKYPSLDLLETHGSEKIIHDQSELETHKNQIISTLKNYDIQIQKISATVGPTVTLYEIVPAAGVRISRIKNLEDDIALSLAALGIRIIAPIPGKGTIGIEVPNVKKTVVSMKTLLASEKFQHNNYSLPIAIGKKIDNENFIVDLTTMPHLLMAGATGQGKSVGINSILVSLLYKKHPSQLKLVLVDPKKVELSLYRTIEKHFLAKLPGEEEAIITDTKKVIHTLNALCIEMDTRYDLLKEAGARNIREYNEKFIRRKLNPQKGHQFLPFIVLVIDEFADLIMTAGKEIEMPLARLAQLARAVGIHLIIATQRPSVNIITGTIKANFPARIAFKVSSKVDSRTILDTGGAEQLIGKGDMLISFNGEITRLQCAFVDTPEVETICEFVGSQLGFPQAFLLPEYIDERELEGREFDLGDRDPLFEDAARLIVQSQIGSTSLLQRRMKLGYNRAGRLMDQLEAAGVVGPSQGSKTRDVLIRTEMELDHLLSPG